VPGNHSLRSTAAVQAAVEDWLAARLAEAPRHASGAASA
jgi:hypothetical protein